MSEDTLKLFALDASRAHGARIAAALGVALSEHEERNFEDGEHKARPLVNVRGRDVCVVQSLYGEPGQSVNDKLCRLLFFIGALVDASARSVTAVIPYLCYARKEVKTKPRDPVTTRYLAGLFEAVGTHRVMALEVHNLAAFQNAFRCRTDHLDANRLFIDHFSARPGAAPLVVVSPDAGGVKRAERFRQGLSRALDQPVGSAFLEKHRSGGVVRGDAVVGDVAGKTALIVDDLISTGATLARAAASCRAQGAREVHAVATHGLFVHGIEAFLADPALDTVVVTDSVAVRAAGTNAAKLAVLDTAPLFAEAIARVAGGGSIVELLES